MSTNPVIQHTKRDVKNELTNEDTIDLYLSILDFLVEFKENCPKCIGKKIFDIENDEEHFCHYTCPQTNDIDEMNQVLDNIIQSNKFLQFDWTKNYS